MDNTQMQFMDILSAGIRGNNVKKIYDNVNWKEILNLSERHKVEGIIYLTLRKSNLLSKLNNEEINSMKKKVTITGIQQSRNISALSKIFDEITKRNIHLIVLKGLVVREFYPQPDQRSMCDADILVNEKDVDVVKEILIKMGYKFWEDHDSSHHIALYHPVYPLIEIHWNLFKRDGFTSELESYEKLIWKDVIDVYVGETKVSSLNYEDLALHLCMHMASHLASTGFGVRQLSDLVLLVEKKNEDIDWNKFIIKAQMYGFEKFASVMFILCRELFDMQIPKEILIKKLDERRYITALINEIFTGGVYGKNDMTSQFGNQVAFNFNNNDNNATIGAISRYLRFIFPKIEDMSNEYYYVKKIKILLPIAWIHHLFKGIFTNKYSFKEKLNFLIKGASIAIKKNKLLEWMEL